MIRVVAADGRILERILDTLAPSRRHDLDRAALARFDAAGRRTAWALRHQQRVALVEGDTVLASAQRCDLTARLDQRPVRVCAIGELFHDPDHADGDRARLLLEHILEDAAARGAELALLIAPAGATAVADGFQALSTADHEIRVTESAMHGAPMTPLRGGEDRDLQAIVTMGQTRARDFRFHLERDSDYVKHAITRTRLLAGVAPAGVRQLQFVIAEEGITAAAYVVISVSAGTWTIEECGDRDPSGARVGAILQALIALEPIERRPTIRGWLPPGFTPPQITIVATTPSSERLFVRSLAGDVAIAALGDDDVIYWRSDLL